MKKIALREAPEPNLLADMFPHVQPPSVGFDGPVVENLMTPCAVTATEPGRMILKDLETQTRLVLSYDHSVLKPEVETINLEDAKLTQTWGPRLYRIRLAARSESLQQTWRISFSK